MFTTFAFIGYHSIRCSTAGFYQESGNGLYYLVLISRIGVQIFKNRGFKIFQFSPNAIDLTFCQSTVGESEHIQAEDTGFSEQGDVTIIHYHQQANEENKFLYWHGML